MANLVLKFYNFLQCILGSHKINGVAKIHSDILKDELFKEFFEIWPSKFLNVTNGVTPRRWIRCANPELTKIYDKWVGNNMWAKKMELLEALKKNASDPKFQKEWSDMKQSNKNYFANWVAHRIKNKNIYSEWNEYDEVFFVIIYTE